MDWLSPFSANNGIDHLLMLATPDDARRHQVVNRVGASTNSHVALFSLGQKLSAVLTFRDNHCFELGNEAIHGWCHLLGILQRTTTGVGTFQPSAGLKMRAPRTWSHLRGSTLRCSLPWRGKSELQQLLV
jgi:hypothetical protein